ncbi:hypothetical protein AMTR_s00068p00192210 [Amborella trichopoda]|uniref:Peptidase A1 domain-containing protein n=1 Tax=Amborella trichopoda TaxID=13333 RepID=U5DE98_AMBTC|nr:hypothetical protein AMTR_s00068p00192210 [Amborella trichopoda]
MSSSSSRSMRSLFLFITYIALSLTFQAISSQIPAITAQIPAETEPESIKLHLLHRHGRELRGNPTNGAPPSKLDDLRELLHHDQLRKQMIHSALRGRSRGGVGAAMSISSGAFAGTGQYFVKFRAGTPPQNLLLVADTGSDLTWMNCRFRPKTRVFSPRINGTRVFRASSSSSFSPLLCSAPSCPTLPFSLTACPTASTPCRYDYRYVDGSFARGFFANESVTLSAVKPNGRHDGNVRLRHLLIGCSDAFQGRSFKEADGVLGLGQSAVSFAVQLSRRFDGKFSYCLVDHLAPKNHTSFLIFGNAPGANRSLSPKEFRRTPLILDQALQPFYGVKVRGISLDGKLVEIPDSVWMMNLTAQSGGVILDSGTTLTALVEPAYEAVLTAFKEKLTGVRRVELSPFDFCFNSSSSERGNSSEVEREREIVIPKMVWHLGGGVRFEPRGESYVIDVAKGVKCLGIQGAAWPGFSTIGNIMQQSFYWEFDLKNGMLGFGRSSCSTS